MLIVSGRLFLKPGTRDQFLASCEASVRLARRAPGCLDFAVSADTIEPDRANVYEAWTDAQSLESFREGGADDPSFSFIVHADVERHEVSQSGPP
jgi:quinol monooxygenase YgiN